MPGNGAGVAVIVNFGIRGMGVEPSRSVVRETERSRFEYTLIVVPLVCRGIAWKMFF